jgi:hypothetical protein
MHAQGQAVNPLQASSLGFAFDYPRRGKRDGVGDYPG